MKIIRNVLIYLIAIGMFIIMVASGLMLSDAMFPEDPPQKKKVVKIDTLSIQQQQKILLDKSKEQQVNIDSLIKVTRKKIKEKKDGEGGNK